jgi:hypothetical protein
MGRQLGFYMTRIDIAEMDVRLRAIEHICFLKAFMNEPRLEILPSSVLEDELLFRRLLITHDELLGWFKIGGPNVNKEFHLSALTGHYPAIEYDTGPPQPDDTGVGVMRPKRIYYNATYFNTEGIITKQPDIFLLIAKQVFTLFKKHLTYVKTEQLYYGRDALEKKVQGLVRMKPY